MGEKGVVNASVIHNQPYLSIQNVTKRFGFLMALDHVSLDVQRSEFVCILGPSGCGKTTLLRVVAGLEEQDQGSVFLDGANISKTPPSRRNFGIVFQSYALFPNLTSAQNIGYGLKSQKRSRKEMTSRVEELLTLVDLEEFRDKYPSQLSGGQQQRVALARALALSPSLLLLDEPLSALDARVREKLRYEVRHLQEQLKVTTVMVTHDQVEALTMADRIVVMDRGKIIQSGTPHDIYHCPVNPFVADFVGSMNFFDGTSVGENHHFQFGGFQLATEFNHLPRGEKVTLAIRPEHVQVVMEDVQRNNHLPAKVDELEFRGPFCRMQLVIPTESKESSKMVLSVDISTDGVRRMGIHRDQSVRVHLPSDRLLVFPKTAG